MGKRIAVLTGAGISRESGLKTFRDEDGLWGGFQIEDVCTPEALQRNPQRVLDFYNMRRTEARQAEPNAAHLALADLEQEFEVTVVTQNIDDLHERAGSTRVIHIHGEVFRVRSMANEEITIWTEGEVNLGDLGPDGAQLRPHVCFFGEIPYDWEEAVRAVKEADAFAVIGTSLQVYPAAGLLDFALGKPTTLIDPAPGRMQSWVEVIPVVATVGVPAWVKRLVTSGV